jgi:hypothetical protein
MMADNEGEGIWESCFVFGPRGEPIVRREFNVLALIKGKERYVFVYDETSRTSLIDVFRDSAADPALSFSWFDAAVLTQKAREQEGSLHAELPPSRTRL